MNNDMNHNIPKKTMRKALFFAAAATLMTLAACSDKETDDGASNGRIAVKVTNAGIVGSIRNSPSTRATDNTWQAGDAIGIILFEAETFTPVDENTTYRYVTATAAGSFSPADDENTAYYPTQGKEADVLAFYPYQAIGTDFGVPVSTADQTTLSQIDLMVSSKSKGHSATRPDVSLSFGHKLVKLAITVDREASATDVDLQGATLALKGTATQARWNLKEEKLIVDANSKADINIPMTYDAAGKISVENAVSTLPGVASATAIVLPTAAGAGVKLVITTTSGKVFDAPLPASSALTAGTVNTLRVHLRRNEAVITASVADWTTGVTVNLPVTIGNITAIGSITGDELALADGDKLEVSETATTATGTYIYSAGAWTNPVPLYWDDLTTDGSAYTFSALLTPAGGSNTTTGLVKDYLGGTTGDVAFGSPIAFGLSHLMAQISITVKPGTGYEDVAPADITASLNNLKQLKSMGIDGTFTSEAADAPLKLVLAEEPKAKGKTAAGKAIAAEAAKAYTATALVVPQTLAKGTLLVSIDIQGSTYTYSAPEGGFAFKPGKKNSITLTVNKSGMDLSFTLDDWGEDGSKADEDGELEDPVKPAE